MNQLPGYVIILLITVCAGLPQQGEDDEYYDNPTDGYEDDSKTGDSVHIEKPQFIGRSSTITVQEGDDLEISCKTVKPSDYIMFFNKESEGEQERKLIYVGGMKVIKESRFENNNNIFKLPNVRRNDAGTYSCHFQEIKDIQLKYKVDVQYPPSVRAKSPSEQRVQKGATVTVECQARGNPEPIITWSKGSGRLPSGAEKEEGYSMTLENVDRHVEGTYICTASNEVGESASASMKIVVEYPPEITTEKAIVRTGEGDKVELVCIVHSRPQAEVTWSKDGSPLTPTNEIAETDGGHRHALTISRVTEEQFGSYQCNAINSMGENFAVINLTDLPRQPHFTSPSTSAEETSYTLGWETESYYPITEYIVKYRQAKANDSTDIPGEWIEVSEEVSGDNLEEASDGLIQAMKHTINDLFPATDYQAIVSVKNQYKWGDEGRFNFSTRKASPTTIATTTTTSTPLPLAEENMQFPSKETVSRHKTSGAGFLGLNGVLCITSLVLSMIS